MGKLTRPGSVLVVDDDAAIRAALAEVLSAEGYEVRAVENGVQALEAMRSSVRPDVVILDLMMPVMSGWEVLLEAEADPALGSIPIVVASAMAVPVAGSSQRGGVRGCLAKPLDIGLLLEMLESVRSMSRLDAAARSSRPPVASAAAAIARLRVLLVESSPADAKLLENELHHSGREVYAERVGTAAEYCAALDRQNWDVILSAFSIPGFGGMEALDLLRARGLDVPFIIVSAVVGEEVAVMVMKRGAHDFFSKDNLGRLNRAVDREVREAAGRRDQVVEGRRTAAELKRTLCDLRSAVKVRDEFLAVASHELKTPLTSLQLQVQLLHRLLSRTALREPDTREDRAPSMSLLEGKVCVIEHQVTRLATLVESLVDASAVGNGPMTLEREKVDLKELVASVLARSEAQIRDSGSQISVRSESVFGSWDRSRIESVATNLISNAVKYGEGRPIEIEVNHPTEAARLVVRDHGIGMSLDEQTRVFGKFERAVPVEHYGGLGLGLWAVQQAIIAHGGQIHCESRPGAGSTFTVDLPRLSESTA
jgi:signal transduction histidine kinase